MSQRNSPEVDYLIELSQKLEKAVGRTVTTDELFAIVDGHLKEKLRQRAVIHLSRQTIDFVNSLARALKEEPEGESLALRETNAQKHSETKIPTVRDVIKEQLKDCPRNANAIC